MRGKTIKAFTLVEMLIVIVIIGILIASLMPRMQQAQSRARDVTRKNDLAQVQTALISYLGDTGKLPKCPPDKEYTSHSGCHLEDIEKELKAGGLDIIPKDPLEGQDYRYSSAQRDGHDDQGFRVAANTEVPGVSNFVFTDFSTDNRLLKLASDTATFQPCKKMVEVDAINSSEFNPGGTCKGYAGHFWYVVTY